MFSYETEWEETKPNHWIGTMAPMLHPHCTETIGTISKSDTLEIFTALDVEMETVESFETLTEAQEHLERYALDQLPADEAEVV